MRILLVSQMYPGPADPDLGTFVAQLERALREALRARCTIGELCNVLRDEFGMYDAQRGPS